MNDVIAYLTTYWADILQIVAYVISGASVLVKITPTPKDDAVLQPFIRILSWLSLAKKPPVVDPPTFTAPPRF